jgi:hypothetical protein
MDYRQLAYQTAQKYGIDPDLFVRQIQAESAFRPDAVSSAGAIGLGQLMPATAKELGVDPNDPVQNLEGAARYMKQQLDRFGDPALALAAYNAGPSRVAKANGVPNITETQNYVAKILGGKGGAAMAQQPQQSQGLLGGLLGGQGIGGALGMSDDFRDKLKMAILAGTGDARMAPLIQATQAQMQERRATRNVNKTVDWLRKNVSEEVAQAVANNPGIASNVMSSVLAQRLKPTDAGFRVATPEEAAQYGAQAGQFDAEGRFYPTQKVEMTQEVGGKSKFTEAGQAQLAKDFGEMAAAGRDATSNLGKIRLLGDLLEEAGTGITAGFASRANQLFGVDFRTNAAAAAEALISQLVPAQRPPGSGTISDADLALYKASLPSISGTPGGNKLIIQSMVAITEHNQKVGRIASKVLTDPNYSISQAEDDIAALPDPFAGVRSFFGSAPAGGAEEPLSREGALEVLQGAGVIDTDG